MLAMKRWQIEGEQGGGGGSFQRVKRDANRKTRKKRSKTTGRKSNDRDLEIEEIKKGDLKRYKEGRRGRIKRGRERIESEIKERGRKEEEE